MLAEVAQLAAEGVLVQRDDLDFVVTETVAPGIELGYSVPSAPPCRYPTHRNSDWRSPLTGRLICGECHPPAAREAP